MSLWTGGALNKEETGGDTPHANIKKRDASTWFQNPCFYVIAAETAEVELTLARHDDCWAKQKEQVRFPNPKP